MLFTSYLVANCEYRFSCDVAHISNVTLPDQEMSHVSRRSETGVVIVLKYYHTSHVASKHVFGVCDHVRLKPACSVSEAS